MPTLSDADAEAWVLTADEGHALLAAVSSVTAPGPAELTRWRKLAPADRTAAALRIAEGRRRGAAKFSRADRMWFERTGLEQSTAEAVAAHKAVRFADRARTVVDLCAGIGGDTLALAAGADLLAVDTDHGMARRALWNARVYGVESRVAAVRARAESFGIPRGAWVHIDPDRRARGRRARDLGGYQPGLDFLRSLTRTIPGGAIKLGPASDFADHFGENLFEVELVSLGGECKEATVWFGEPVTCRRRATRLPEGATWTDRDGPRDGYAAFGPVLGWVFDPDPSIARAGLL
ncbi:MAG: class I SAM-dependent methyltransferase, partial [Planctomycetia bacterium]|nr:class I SAM-dependent methyltransferase [Planctomycetia bacterium]